MSETLTLTNGGTGTTYGTFSEAQAYLKAAFGDQYDEWNGLVDDDARKRTLIAATRFIDRQVWADEVNTFALRDALVSADSAKLFQLACYELAALVADDASILTLTDQGTNIQSAMAGGGTGVTYFNPTSSARGTAPELPPILMDLVGAYLASDAVDMVNGSSQSGDCSNPFDRAHELKRWDPF